MNNQQLSGQLLNSDNPIPDLLVRAVMAGHLATVHDQGLAPDAACKHGYMALYLAAFHGRCDACKKDTGFFELRNLWVSDSFSILFNISQL